MAYGFSGNDYEYFINPDPSYDFDGGLGGVSDDDEPEAINYSNHDSESEEELEDHLTEELATVNGKDGTVWYISPVGRPFVQGEPPRSSLTEYSYNASSIIQSWNIFVTFIDEIVECTNLRIQSQRHAFKRQRDCRQIDAKELRAAIGLLYIAGSLKLSRTRLKDIWNSDGTGVDSISLCGSFGLITCIREMNDEW